MGDCPAVIGAQQMYLWQQTNVSTTLTLQWNALEPLDEELA